MNKKYFELLERYRELTAGDWRAYFKGCGCILLAFVAFILLFSMLANWLFF